MPKRLAIGGCLAIVMILALVLLVSPSVSNHQSFSKRLCPAGYYSSFQSSLPLFRGGPAEQFNLVCVKIGTPIYAQHLPFVHKPRVAFGRLRQDPYAVYYNG